MENNNGRGIFYGVIGVATLVVAIIGATFAYFSASITQNDVLNVQSTTLTLAIVNEVTNYKTDLIPVETEAGEGNVDSNGVTLFARYVGTESTKCVDDVGNDICSVYTFAIQNPSDTTAQTVVGSMTVTSNGFNNLTYAVFKGAASEITSFDVNKSAEDVNTADVGDLVFARKVLANSSATDFADKKTDAWPLTQQRLAAGAKQFYTVVVWLEETGGLQDTEQTQSFAASINFTSNTGSGVTGVLSTS